VRKLSLSHFITTPLANVIVLLDVFCINGETAVLAGCLHYTTPLTPELNPSAQRCLTRFFTGDFAS
jgi:hypothetical protein